MASLPLATKGNGTTTAPLNPGGRLRAITTETANALLKRLKEEDDLNLDEQAYFLQKCHGR